MLCPKKFEWKSNIFKKTVEAVFWISRFCRSSLQRCSVKKGVLRNFAKLTGKHLWQSLFFNKVAGLWQETLTQVFSCEFCEISKNTFFTEHLWATGSDFVESKFWNNHCISHFHWTFDFGENNYLEINR